MFFFSYIFVMVNQKTFYKFKTVTKMKKMIFTAMAVLAFSAVSMANTIEVKEEVVENKDSKVKGTIVRLTVFADCYSKAVAYLERYDRYNRNSQAHNEAVYNAYLDGCLQANR
jgi:hypothetical protein